LAYDGDLGGKPSYRSGNAVCYWQTSGNPDAWVIYYDDTNPYYAAWYSFQNVASPELVTFWNPATTEGGTPVVSLFFTGVFEVGDVVTYEGETWYCYTAYTFNPASPQNPEIGSAYWQLIAAKGDTGDTGNTGETGTAATITAGTTTTGAAGSSASVTNVGTNSEAVFDFTIPRGDTGATGPATELSVASTTTGAAGTNASVTISGTAPVQSLAFTIPRGPQGIQGETGSSGATALLTGYVSGAGTVAATDTVIQAVGKLNGNDELKAPIASLYPYIGGKLLTYLDEEAAIADPLISAGDIYRKTAGGVDYVNPDNVPSLDLRFATDKTLTARRGPTPTFTRGSGATYIGSDGLIHGIDTSTTSNSISAASKTFTLDATAGQDQFWRAGDAVEASNGANIMAGTVTSYNAATQSLVCNMTTVSGTGTFTSWRIGYRGPRFDHTSAGVCRGLLIEESRTNTILTSDNLSSSQWNASGLRNLTVSVDNTTSPSGATDADRLTVGATTTTYSVVQNTITLTSGTVYAYSAFVKANEVTRVSLWAGNTTTLQVDAVFDLTGSGSVVLATAGTASIQQVGNGWYRCIVTGTAGANSSTSLRISPASGTSRNYSGNSVDSFWAWGAQLEAGSSATSYIPTVASTVVRSADVCNITGANFNNLWNTSGGTFLFEGFLIPSTGINLRMLSSGGNRRWLYGNQPGVGTVAETLALYDGTSTPNYFTNVRITTRFKMAISVEALTCKASFNGSAISTVSHNGNLLNSVTLLGFFETASGFITGVKYYRKNLSNAKLQALTV
jgi:hypothetical protein